MAPIPSASIAAATARKAFIVAIGDAWVMIVAIPTANPDDELGVALVLREWDEAWTQSRHLEAMRSQYLGFFFAATLGVTAVTAKDLLDDAFTSPGSLVTIVALALGLQVLSAFLYVAVVRINCVLNYYQRLIYSIKGQIHGRSGVQVDLSAYEQWPRSPRVGWAGRVSTTQGTAELVLVIATSMFPFRHRRLSCAGRDGLPHLGHTGRGMRSVARGCDGDACGERLGSCRHWGAFARDSIASRGRGPPCRGDPSRHAWLLSIQVVISRVLARGMRSTAGLGDVSLERRCSVPDVDLRSWNVHAHLSRHSPRLQDSDAPRREPVARAPVSACGAERAASRSGDALGEVLARCVRARAGAGGVVARCLDLETQPVQPIELGTHVEKPMSSREVRSLAEQAWERLMQYHDIWGCFPWERTSRPRSSTELEPTVDPKRAARELGEYLKARATLRREAEERVRATSFFASFTQAASDIGMGWLETLLTAPGEVIKTIGGQTRDEFLADEHWEGPSVGEFEELTIGGLMDLVLKAELLTGSCGSTAGLIHEIVNPASANTTPVATDAGGVIEALTRAGERSTSSGETQYVRIEGGGHAFVVEVGGGTCRLLQSFLGTSTLARDLGLGKAYSLRSLAALLRVALLPNAEPTSQAQTKIVRARRELFASQAVHPDARGFKVHEFGCQPGIQERLAERRSTGERLWEPVLLESASSIKFVEPLPQVTHAPLTGEHVIPHSGSDHLFYFGEGFTPISTRDLKEGKRYAMRFAGQLPDVKVTSNANGHVVVTVLAADDTDEDSEDAGNEK